MCTLRSISGRIVSLSWWTFAWFVVAMYTASLGASLILSEINYPANELIKTARCPRVSYKFKHNSINEFLCDKSIAIIMSGYLMLFAILL